MQSEVTERFNIDRINAKTRLILVRSLANRIADADEGLRLGVLGGAGSGRSTLIKSICDHLANNNPEGWVVIPFDVATHFPAQGYASQSSEPLAQIIRTLAYSLLGEANSYCFSAGIKAFFSSVFSGFSLLIRFALSVRFAQVLLLLLELVLFVVLLTLYQWGAISGLPMHAVSLMEVGSVLILVGLFVLILRSILELFCRLPDKLTVSELQALFRCKSAPLLGIHKRIVVVATGFHRCALSELPQLLESLQAVLGSMRASVIYELEPSATLAAFAADYQVLGRYQQSLLVRHLARERLSRLIGLPINLDLFFSSSPQTQPIFGEFQCRNLNERQSDLFTKWCMYFDLNNPRQRNRLRDSYQLVLSLYGEEESISKGDNSTLDNLTADITCPLLITLCALEYVYSFDDQQARAELFAWLSRVSQRGFAEESERSLAEIDAGGKLSEEIVSIINRHNSLIKPFVLPALELPAPHSSANQG